MELALKPLDLKESSNHSKMYLNFQNFQKMAKGHEELAKITIFYFEET